MRLIIYKSNGGFRWRLKAANNRIVAASSEAFSSRAGARRNAIATFWGLWHGLGMCDEVARATVGP